MFVLIGTKFDATGINETIDKAKDLEKKVADIASGFKIVGAALTGFAAAGVGLMVNLTKAAAENELAQLELAGAMKKAGTYTEEAFRHAVDYAGALQKITTFTDEEIMSAQKLMTNFGIEGVMLDKLTEATLDFATAKGIGLVSASFLVAKSVGSSTNALAKYGIEITGAKGSTTRMEHALDGITKLFGGAATTKAKSFTGKVEIMRHRIDELKERIGAYLIPVIEKMLKRVDKAIDYFEKLSPETQKLIANVLLLGTAIAGTAGGLLLFIGYIPTLITALTKGMGAITLITTSLSPMTLGIIAVSAAIVGVIVALDSWIAKTGEFEGAKAKQWLTIEGTIDALKREKTEIVENWKAGKITQEEALEFLALRNKAIAKYSEDLEAQKAKEKEVAEATAVNVEEELTLFEEAKTKKIAYFKDTYDYMVNTNQLTLKEQKSILEDQLAIVETGTTDELALRKKLWDVNQELAATSFDSIEAGWAYAVEQMKLKQEGWGTTFVKVTDALETGLADALEDMLDGTETFAEAMGDLWDGLKKAIVKILVDLAAEKIVLWFIDFITSSKEAPATIRAKSISIINDLEGRKGKIDITKFPEPPKPPTLGDYLDIVVTQLIAIVSWIGDIFGLQKGIRNFTGGLAIVGEEGAELINLPRGTNVYTHHETERILSTTGGGNIIVNLGYVSNRRQAKYLGEIVGNEILSKLKRNRKI